VDKSLQISRFLICMVLSVMVSACGYRPLYSGSEGGGVVAELRGISVQEPTDRVGQLVRNKLLSSMRPAGTAGEDRFKLILVPAVAKTLVVDQARPGIQRWRLRLNVSYRLVDIGTGKDINAGKTFSAVSYDNVHEPIADIQAESNALSRAAGEVGSDIHTRLAAFMSSRNGA
jgi:LPS-assembly lipoprotein